MAFSSSLSLLGSVPKQAAAADHWKRITSPPPTEPKASTAEVSATALAVGGEEGEAESSSPGKNSEPELRVLPRVLAVVAVCGEQLSREQNSSRKLERRFNIVNLWS